MCFAGIGPDGDELANVKPDSFDNIININLTGTFNGVSTFAAYMQEKGSGHIVNTASMAGLTINPKLGPYTTTKFALVGMTEVLRKELEPSNVGATVFCPGLVKTRLDQSSGADKLGEAGKNMQQGMDPAEAVQAVVSAVKENRLYAISHKERKPSVESRTIALLEAFD